MRGRRAKTPGPMWALCGLLLACPLPVAAYIDPGSGSALFYMVSGVLVSLYFGLRGLYYRAVELLFRVRYRGQSCELAVHCEDPRYEITFMPVMRKLAERGIDITCFTMYPRDASFEPLPPGVAHREIAPGLVGYSYLNHLEARLLVTTTPQLDVMMFRRSPRVRHYAHLQHALGESRYVRPYAFDFFDSVLCCGPILKRNLRRMEAIRGFPAKRLLETGIPHYEALIAAREAEPGPAHAERPTVLVAPSWGPLSLFEAFGTSFLADLAHRFRVVVRPHPQMRYSQAALYAQILAVEGVEVDTRRTPTWAMSQAHILLSDISGITHEFAFIHERPVVVIDRQLALGGLEGELLGGDSELKAACASFIVPLPPEQMPVIAERLVSVLAQHSRENIVRTRDSLVYNFGTASEVAAAQLAALLDEQREPRSQAAEVRTA